jgi:dUTP pyrophosphatase
MISDYGDDLLPRRATPGSAGYDFFFPKRMECFPMDVKAVDSYYEVDTGIHLEEGDLQPDEVLLLMPKSGIGKRTGFYLSNTVGVIDSDYRDSIKAYFNIEKGILDLKRGDAFMQGVIVKFGTFPQDKPVLEKRTGGFGSTADSVKEAIQEDVVAEPKKRGRRSKVIDND